MKRTRDIVSVASILVSRCDVKPEVESLKSDFKTRNEAIFLKLWDIAHSRTGDKGNISNISLIAYDPKDYALLKERVTAERVKEHFKGMVKGEVVRYELPNIHALNFVMYAALGGGVTRSLSVDMHGKGLSSYLLDMEL